MCLDSGGAALLLALAYSAGLSQKILARSSPCHSGRSFVGGYNGGGPSVLDANAATGCNGGAPTGFCGGLFNFGGAVAGGKMPFRSSQPDIAEPLGFSTCIPYFPYGLGQSPTPFEISDIICIQDSGSWMCC